jgi:hypothetical protein
MTSGAWREVCGAVETNVYCAMETNEDGPIKGSGGYRDSNSARAIPTTWSIL